MPTPDEHGKIHRRIIDGMQPLEYYYCYRPQSLQPGRVVISIHGISRNAEEHIRGFIPQAEKYGAAIIAPFFPKDNFPRYQQLGKSADAGRADLAFDHIIQDASEWLQQQCGPLRIFGFSGGGQFAHRYAMFYPKRVRRLVLAAPGWYTFPDPDRHYPLGLRSSKAWPKLSFSAERFLGIPTLVTIGDEDDLRDADLNKAREIDAFQGFNRIERGERWINAMRALGRAFAVPTDFRFERIPNANHAYESYQNHPAFGEQVFDFLFAADPATSQI